MYNKANMKAIIDSKTLVIVHCLLCLRCFGRHCNENIIAFLYQLFFVQYVSKSAKTQQILPCSFEILCGKLRNSEKYHMICLCVVGWLFWRATRVHRKNCIRVTCSRSELFRALWLCSGVFITNVCCKKHCFFFFNIKFIIQRFLIYLCIQY